MHLMRAITIRKSPEEVYAYWRNFSNLPRFMLHLQDVRVIDNTHSHWVTKAPIGGGTVEWDAEIVEDRPNELIAWRSLEGATVPNSGHVSFNPAPRDQGAEVRVHMDYEVPAGKLGEAFAALFGEDPARQVYDALRNFKSILETGEILFSDASIHGKPHPAQPSDKIPAGAGIMTDAAATNAGAGDGSYMRQGAAAQPDAGLRPGMDIRRAPGAGQSSTPQGKEIKGEVTE